MRLIDADALIFEIWETTIQPEWCKVLTDKVIRNQPTVDAVPIEFIEEQIKEAEKVEEWELNHLGQIDNMYSSAYQNLLKAWAERKEE